MPPEQRRIVSIFIDEAHEFIGGLPHDLSDALAQARSLGGAFHLAHQYRAQLSPAMMQAIENNARNKLYFGLSSTDAAAAARLAPELEAVDFQLLPAFHAYAHLLADGDLQPPTLIRTTPPTPAQRHPNEAALVSRRRYGQSLTDIEADLAALIPSPYTKNNGTSQAETIGRVRRPRASVDPDQKGAAS